VRSSLCLLPLGCINPVLQLTREMSQRHGARVDSGAFDALRSPSLVTLPAAVGAALPLAATASDSGLSSVSGGGGGAAAAPASRSMLLPDVTAPGQLRDSMNFDDFWCWCQSCRHGG